MTPVYTYWDQPRRLTSPANRRLLDFWALTWAAHGWVPVVLGQSDLTEADRLWHSDTTRNFPTINGRTYEDACWERWSALRNVGGGVFVDADVFNFGWPPTGAAPLARYDFVALQPYHNIGAHWCSESGAQHLRELFSCPEYVRYRTHKWYPGQGPHISDMTVICAWLANPEHDSAFTTSRVCHDFNRVSSDFRGAGTPSGASLVHFSNDAMARHAGHTDRVAAALWLAALQGRPVPPVDP